MILVQGSRAVPFLPMQVPLQCHASKAQTALCIRASTFTQNSAGSGGAVSIVSDQLQLNMHDSHFDSNNAIDDSEGGGDVFITSYSYGTRSNGFAATNCSFTDNYAAANGGAVYLEDITNALLRNCTLSHNEAERGGGLCVISQCNTASSSVAMIRDSKLIRPGHAFDCHVQLEDVEMSHNLANLTASKVTSTFHTVHMNSGHALFDGKHMLPGTQHVVLCTCRNALIKQARTTCSHARS